jgi:hypothetical protein
MKRKRDQFVRGAESALLLRANLIVKRVKMSNIGSGGDGAEATDSGINFSNDSSIADAAAESNYNRILREKNALKVKRWREKQRSLARVENLQLDQAEEENSRLREERQVLTARLCELNEAIAEIQSKRSDELQMNVSLRASAKFSIIAFRLFSAYLIEIRRYSFFPVAITERFTYITANIQSVFFLRRSIRHGAATSLPAPDALFSLRTTWYAHFLSSCRSTRSHALVTTATSVR